VCVVSHRAMSSHWSVLDHPIIVGNMKMMKFQSGDEVASVAPFGRLDGSSFHSYACSLV
jgi:hypothetical protein